MGLRAERGGRCLSFMSPAAFQDTLVTLLKGPRRKVLFSVPGECARSRIKRGGFIWRAMMLTRACQGTFSTESFRERRKTCNACTEHRTKRPHKPGLSGGSSRASRMSFLFLHILGTQINFLPSSSPSGRSRWRYLSRASRDSRLLTSAFSERCANRRSG